MSPLHHSPESLRWALNKTGLTQRELADAVGVSRSHMSEMLSGNRNCQPKTLRKIAEVLNAPVVLLEAKRNYEESA